MLTSWKKKKTSMYLNRHRRYRYKNESGRPMTSLFKKRETEGENEWVCTHCDLTFDNSSLLNLHTLTHAAEDVGLDEIANQITGQLANQIAGQLTDTNSNGDTNLSLVDDAESLTTEIYPCPVCRQEFQTKRDLIEHASTHAKVKRKTSTRKPFKCTRCWKGFLTDDRLQKHMLCHGDDESKPLQCAICFKRFMNNSAMACHLKTHSDKKYYDCPICHAGFNQLAQLKEHTLAHMVNGMFTCPECLQPFPDYSTIRKHMRTVHTNKAYQCPHCPKVFSRHDKLKLHMLRHSNHREFMCETCGRQFKRKDKLKEHISRMHAPDRETLQLLKSPKSNRKRFVPKVSPNDYHRFIYKCHMCLLGFKRRGMLVNHLAKRHPDIKPEAVPELNLPILKTQRDYYCQYCDKVYKSSSKRKVHILKNHPGADLPLSSRKKSAVVEVQGYPNPTYSQAVGSVTTVPHPCTFCHKQYASKAKLLQHQRKKHCGMVPPASQRQRPTMDLLTGECVVDDKMKLDVDYEDALQTVQADHIEVHVQTPTDSLQAADLLTQAMSELTQTLGEYRQPTEYQITVPQRTETTITNLPSLTSQPGPATIELSQLGQLVQAHYQNQQGQVGQVQLQVPVSSDAFAQQTVVVASPVTTGTLTNLQAATVSYVPRSWTNNFQTYR